MWHCQVPTPCSAVCLLLWKFLRLQPLGSNSCAQPGFRPADSVSPNTPRATVAQTWSRSRAPTRSGGADRLGRGRPASAKEAQDSC
eukprot:191992-Alexandrium_andersonii.AAC.1